MLPSAVAWSASDNNATCYVFSILWMTSCFHIMARHKQYEQGIYSSDSSEGSTGGQSLTSTIALFQSAPYFLQFK